jgi:PKD domain
MTAGLQPAQSVDDGNRVRMKRLGVVLTVWAMGLAGVSASVVFPSSASAALPAAAPTTPGAYASLTPERLLDTRVGLGAAKVAVAAGRTVTLQVTGQGGVPVSGVSSVVLNVTVTAPTQLGYLTVYGAGTTRPLASNLNFVKGQTVPNLVVAPVGVGGKVTLYNGSAGSIQLIADVSGYYVSGAPAIAGAFGSLAPARLLDTRVGLGAAKAAVAASRTVSLQVTGRSGVPTTGVSAVLLNVTVTAPTKLGFLTAFGAGATRPVASNLNFVARQTVPNLVVAPVGVGGKVTLYNGSTGSTQLIADVAGYYVSGLPATAGAFGSLAPARILDTRVGTGAAPAAVAAGGALALQVIGRGGVPAAVSAVVLNVTVTAPTKLGFLTAYGAGATRPVASSLNFVARQTVPNLVIAPVGVGGKVTLYNGSTGSTDMIADVVGYYLAAAPAVLSINGSQAPTMKLTVGGDNLFDASRSSAGPGLTLSTASLDFGDGTLPLAAFTGDSATWQVNHLYATVGASTATLTVTDSDGQKATSKVAVTVFAAPVATITEPTGSAPAAGDPVPFTLTKSTPAGTAFTDYDFVIVDDATGLNEAAVFFEGLPPATWTHTFVKPGKYTVFFEAFNDAHGSIRTSTKVTVN